MGEASEYIKWQLTQEWLNESQDNRDAYEQWHRSFTLGIAVPPEHIPFRTAVPWCVADVHVTEDMEVLTLRFEPCSRNEWRWVHSGSMHRSCVFESLAGALRNAEHLANRSKSIGIQRWNGRMEVVWYGWDAHNRLVPAHTLPTVRLDPNTYDDD